VAIVGPVEPFRSGIARHTTALARSLQRRPGVQVKVVSFSRQYPALLFPGESDRASDTTLPSDLDVETLLDSLNPLTWALAVQKIRRFRPHLVLAPAWTFFLAPCFTFVLRQLRRQNIPVVAMVHNVADHDGGQLRRRLSTLQLRQADAYITHTHQLAKGIANVVPGAKVKVLPHPVFDYPQPSGSLSRRADLELLMFGIVRAYKGLDVLLRGLSVSKKASVKLSVVGEVWRDAGDVKRLVNELGIEQKVELVLRYLTDAEAAEYFARADVVVLPYRSVTGSGVLPLAFHYGRPVAASRLPGFLELVREGETGWLVPVGDAATWADTIDHTLTAEAARKMGPNIEMARRELSFDRFAEVVLQASADVCSRSEQQ
jgi:D-inositol-3-phosphate glycosyltransferase